MDLLEWKMESTKEMVQPISGQEVCVMNLLQSVRSDYQQLRRELVEVQELQRELSSRLRAQLRLVHGKFARLRQRIAAVPPPR
ncbi:Uncharacterized protein OBRU01_02858 [Operophtera brumata]|uniref:Ska2 N-terminal domain-containing protein n=1 Tax=Operophtera brumata TaxID=104452 RepID=A0A0L7LS51_OPEBR|nr:Uncharacterized protein OBRU01_02858 [Operophtera brumata]